MRGKVPFMPGDSIHTLSVNNRISRGKSQYEFLSQSGKKAKKWVLRRVLERVNIQERIRDEHEKDRHWFCFWNLRLILNNIGTGALPRFRSVSWSCKAQDPPSGTGPIRQKASAKGTGAAGDTLKIIQNQSGIGTEPFESLQNRNRIPGSGVFKIKNLSVAGKFLRKRGLIYGRNHRRSKKRQKKWRLGQESNLRPTA